MDWIGNILIIIGLWSAGNKWKYAFLFSLIGELIWVIYAIKIELWSLAFVCVVFAFIAGRNVIKWNKKEERE